MKNLASILRGQRVFVEAVGFVGTTGKVTPPEVEWEQAEVAGREIDTALLKPMEASLELHSMDTILWTAAKKRLGEGASFVIKRSITSGGKEQSVYFEIGGWVKKQGGNDGDVGKEDTTKVDINVQQYKLEVGGKVLYDIDLENDIAIIDGKDVYDKLRKHIQ